MFKMFLENVKNFYKIFLKIFNTLFYDLKLLLFLSCSVSKSLHQCAYNIYGLFCHILDDLSLLYQFLFALSNKFKLLKNLSLLLAQYIYVIGFHFWLDILVVFFPRVFLWDCHPQVFFLYIRHVYWTPLSLFHFWHHLCFILHNFYYPLLGLINLASHKHWYLVYIHREQLNLFSFYVDSQKEHQFLFW